MPELPEVETARLEMDRVLTGKTIKAVYVDCADLIVFDDASPAAVQKLLTGAKVKATHRRGKYFWLELNRRPWPVLHLGMSGHVEVRSPEGWSRAKRRSPGESKTTDEIPPYCKLLLTTTKGQQIAVTDPRRFGRIRLAKDPLHEAPISKLGPDPLFEFPAVAALQHTLGKRQAPIKSVLLDQAVFAGVGNWIADEILFQARISPHRIAASLSRVEVKRIRARTLSIIRKAVTVGADYERFPSSWLFHDRRGQKERRLSFSGTRNSARHHRGPHERLGPRGSNLKRPSSFMSDCAMSRRPAAVSKAESTTGCGVI